MTDDQTAGIAAAILGGQFDNDQLAKISEAVSNRQRMDALTLLAGTRVVVVEGVRPQYLVGSVGVITGRRGEKILVKFDADNGHRRVNGAEWTMTPTSIRELVMA